MSSLAYQRLFEATHELRATAKFRVSDPTTPGCAWCARPWEAVEEPGRAVRYQYESGMAINWVCTTCITPRLGSFEYFGTERMVGNTGKPAAGKLNMMSKTGAVVTTDNTLYVASMNAEKLARYQDGWLARQGRLLHTTPLELLLSLHADGRLGDISEGIVFIGAFIRQADRTMAALTASRDLSEIWTNTPGTPATTLDLAAAFAVRDWVHRYGHEKIATTQTLWKHILDATSKPVEAEATRPWVEKIKGAKELVKLLPGDPRERRALPGLLKTMGVS